MEKIILKSKTRDVVGKTLNKHRKEGLVPAVVYGHKITPHNLWVDFMDFDKVYGQAGESTIIELDIDGKKKANVLIHDIQSDPLTDKFSHVDFFQVKMDEKIETEIPLEFVNASPAVKEMGGVLIKSVDAILIGCLPADLPSKIEVDISKLKTFDNRISIKDLEISDKVKVLVDTSTIVASVAPPRTEEELAQLDEKVEEDVTKVEGVVKETDEGEDGEKAGDEKKEEKSDSDSGGPAKGGETVESKGEVKAEKKPAGKKK